MILFVPFCFWNFNPFCFFYRSVPFNSWNQSTSSFVPSIFYLKFSHNFCAHIWPSSILSGFSVLYLAISYLVDILSSEHLHEQTLPSQILKASDLTIPKRVDRTGVLGRGKRRRLKNMSTMNRCRLISWMLMTWSCFLRRKENSGYQG